MDNQPGIPSVELETENGVINFKFKNIKGEQGMCDSSVLLNYISKDDLNSFLENIQSYLDDNGKIPENIDDMTEWENKQDILDFDYDLDGVFSYVDLYLINYIVVQGVSKIGDKFDLSNNTYNGLSLDINKDGSISTTDASELTRNLMNYRNTSKVDLSYQDIPNINNIIN